LKIKLVSFLAAEGSSPLLDLIDSNLAEDGLRLTDLVLSGNERG